MGKVNVIITDDHKLFRKGIAALLSDFDFVNEIREAGNGVELLDQIKKSEVLPDLILLDVRMPEMDGIEVQKVIREKYPKIKIIILTMEEDEQIVLHLIEQGVNGYLLKNADPDEMEWAIRKVISEGYYFTPEFSRLIVKNVVRKKANKFELKQELTSKEIQVLELICKQFTANEIAASLKLSVRTIEGYRRKLLEKTRSKNLAGLVVFALKNNLVIV